MKLSIIIPTCNERDYLLQTIDTLYQHASGKHRLEILVIDCGSTDGTTSSISDKSVVVVTNPRLAGKKWASLRLGARLAQGDVFLFLDADTILPMHFDLKIEKALLSKKVVGGAFEFGFSEKSLSLSLVVLINRIRYRFRKRFYGDQGIFVRQSAYEKSGGWPQRHILEAAYFCKSLQEYGRLKIIRSAVKTSARRFIEGGVLKVLLHDMRIWFRDLLGLDVEKYAAKYWAYNQNSQASNKKTLSKVASEETLSYP